MKLTLTGKLLDAQRKPVAQAALEALAFTAAGALTLAGRGVTATNGTFKFVTTANFPDGPVPRLRLRLRDGANLRNLVETPAKIAGGVLDYGDILYDPATSHRHGTDTFHGENRTAGLVAMLRADTIRLAADTPVVATAVKPELTLKLKTAETELAATRREATKLKSDLAAATGLVAARATELTRVRDQLTKAHATQLAAIREQLKRAQAENETLKAKTPARVSVEHIALASGRDIESAQRELAGRHGGIRLANVSMEIKGVAEDGGKALSLPAGKDLAALAPALSSLRLQFLPGLIGAKPKPAPADDDPADETDDPLAPDVVGLPEGKARRRLDAERLPHRVYHQAIEDATSHGRILRQTPAAGARVPPGTTLRLIVGTPPAQS